MLALPVMNPSKSPSGLVLFLLPAVFVLAACVPSGDTEMNVILIADGRQRAYVHNQQISVGEFIEQVGLDVGNLDRIVPPEVTQIQDGMTITVVRVREQVECEEIAIPYQQRAIPNEGLLPGEERLAQSGVNGTEEICYRLTIEDGQAAQRVEIQRVVVADSQDEIVFIGVDTSELEAVPVEGTLIYISNGNLWIMRGSSATKRPLTSAGSLDGKVFDLSADGNRILFTQGYVGSEEQDIYFNTLYSILDTRADDPQVHELDLLNNILYSEWVPGRPYTFSYSTAEARDSAPGWQAYNDLWLMRLDDADAVPINVENVVDSSSGGVYGWWGTAFKWSPDGTSLAYSQADGIGTVDLDTGQFTPLTQFPAYTTFQDWVWQPTLSWSPDSELLIFTVHGPPFGAEQPENSPIFNISVVTTTESNGFSADIVSRAGIWAAPQFSPFLADDSEFPAGFIAYLKARNPLNSINDQYDLVIADRDGSNARILFPPARQPGLEPQDVVWSPSGRYVALVYQGNLWAIEAESGRAQQLTIDGGASSPQWGL
jgi:hypothetical protein